MEEREKPEPRSTKRGVKRSAPGSEQASPETLQRLQAVISTVKTTQALKGNDENKENVEPALKKPRIHNRTQNTPERVNYLQGIFTRNSEKLAALVDNAADSPLRRESLILEAKTMTPYLTAMYKSQYTSENPGRPSPLYYVGKHTKPKTHSIGRKTVRKNLQEAFDQEEAATYPAQGSTGERIIYQSDAAFDPLAEDDKGRLNLHRMLKGKAPIGVDRKSLELHHLVRKEPGPLAEMTASMHRRESGVIHFPSRALGDRTDFNSFRSEYWALRAMDWMESNMGAVADPAGPEGIQRL